MSRWKTAASRIDGTYRLVLSEIAPLLDAATGSIISWLETFIELIEHTCESAGRDLRKNKRIEESFRLLSRTGAAVVESLDYKATLQHIASSTLFRLAVSGSVRLNIVIHPLCRF